MVEGVRAGPLEVYAVRRNGALAGVLPLTSGGRRSRRRRTRTRPRLRRWSDEEASRAARRHPVLADSRTVELPVPPGGRPDAVHVSSRRTAARLSHAPAATPPVAVSADRRDWATFETGLLAKFRSELSRRERRLAELGPSNFHWNRGQDALDALLTRDSGSKPTRGRALTAPRSPHVRRPSSSTATSPSGPPSEICCGWPSCGSTAVRWPSSSAFAKERPLQHQGRIRREYPAVFGRAGCSSAGCSSAPSRTGMSSYRVPRLQRPVEARLDAAIREVRHSRRSATRPPV